MAIGPVLFFIVIAAAILYFVFLFARGAGPNWMWRGGRHDPVRNLLFRPDGSWRQFGKLGIVLAIAALAFVAVLGF